MAVFKFDIRPLFVRPIIKVKSDLVPESFCGDRVAKPQIVSKISQIIDVLGSQSAKAQGIRTPFTTAKKLGEADDHIVYLMADLRADGKSAVIGLLKIGKKNLYLFDDAGETRRIDRANSILDFYIHESRQRAGHGKVLFEKMLADENLSALEFTVDRPSEKMLGFLKKHYGLERIIPQANNFVLYEGFFEQYDKSAGNDEESNGIAQKSTTECYSKLDNLDKSTLKKYHTLATLPQDPPAVMVPNGRYAHRPVSRVMFDVMSNNTTF